ncbi:uncharacterized protein SPSK_04408 [Sporothrix schenckii 1099-18]|uniref:Uncharacterized protein n=1 Tax=Sporothrix schenckii 1099-18 TaxID=1397361 RepID=A0A0F2M083_SPOSC|nr:uncharacterized protein SPSK_04408 [Sporothrix schenckii 1099-18]KJR83123.1 hypothetical protein SPSK_04408 [Sporothrix schenckii 1099-18]
MNSAMDLDVAERDQYQVSANQDQTGSLLLAADEARREFQWNRASSDRPTPHILSTYAAVNRQWQRMFEPVTFSTLMVYGDELDDFANCVVGEPGSPKHARLNYLMHLHFHCRLLPYRIDEFNKEEPSNTIRIDNLRFEDQIMGLFAVLAKWDGPEENAKLLLELSAASSGDTFHRVSNFRLNEYYRYGRGEETHHRPNCDIPLLPHSGVPQDVSYSVNDPLPTRRMAGISKDGFGRLGREWQWHAFHTTHTPSIPIVRGLTVSLRFHRVISHTFLTAMILTKLPNLKDIRIEQWRCLDLKGWVQSMLQMTEYKAEAD